MVDRGRLLTYAIAAAAAAPTTVAAAGAASGPLEPRSRWVEHDHRQRGDGWHIEMVVDRAGTGLRRLVLHSERCDETILVRGVPAAADGTIAETRPFTTGDGAEGSWRLHARFADREHARGSFRITEPDCDGGVRRFRIHRERGGSGHDHGGGRRHVAYGTPIGRYPDLDRGSARARRQARSLWRRTVRAARERFPSYRRARTLGFERYPGRRRRPLVFHLRHTAYASDGRIFDARRPESLVYWWPKRRPPMLVAYMYRVPGLEWPRYAKPLLGWHAHGATNVMTHVWLTNDLRSAIANCMPVPALEAAIPAFRWARPGQGFSRESQPCRERDAEAGASPAAARDRTVRVGDNWFVRPSGVPRVTVDRGDTVTWRWVGQDAHNVRGVRGPVRFSSPTKRRGTYRRTFSRAGSYRIVCDIHGGRDQSMRLTVR